jgi:hypothetical protein
METTGITMSNDDDLFLTVKAIERLTGIERGHVKQCEQLKKMNIPFRTNARGEPIVAKAHVLGLQLQEKKTGWHSNLKAA